MYHITVNECPGVSPPINGHITNEELNPRSCGHTITFKCDDGYIIEGPHSMTCLSTGQWDHVSPPYCRGTCILLKKREREEEKEGERGEEER